MFFKRSTISFWIFATAILLLNINTDSFAQVSIRQTVDILQGINDSTIAVVAEPQLSSDYLQKIFDDNPLSTVNLNTDSLVITLIFDDSVRFTESKVFFLNAGNWSLEAARTEDDLNNHSGSYQLLVDKRNQPVFAEDSVTVGQTVAKYVRFTEVNPQAQSIYMGEWNLVSTINLVSLYIYPNMPRLIPGTSLQLHVKALDENDQLHPYTLNEPLMWSTANHSVATVSEFGELGGVAIGNTTVTVATHSGSLTGTTSASVVNDFSSPNAQSMTVKVALVLQDPVIDSVNNRRVHQVWGWSDPNDLVTQLIEEFNQASHGVIHFQIVETVDDDKIWTKIDGNFMTMDTLIYYATPSNNMFYGRNTPGTMQYMAEIENRIHFDYNAMVDYYDFDTKRNNNEINEIWVYSYPFGGMYESQLMGPGAFWYNSPPLAHPGLQKLLSVMGWNYERGVAEAMHSLGHRAESAMVQVYGRWEITNPNPNSWELFTRIDHVIPDGAHVGNIHYPPNGNSDYDYSNPRYVITYADNWKRYPMLLDQTRVVNCTEWGSTQLGYMEWWFGHLPHFEGVYEGVLNNWWYYIVDYESAVAEAAQLSAINSEEQQSPNIPHAYELEQNYPNPFNPVTTIKFKLPVSEKVTVRIFDTLGQEVETLINKTMKPGEYQVRFDGQSLATGIYFYQLSTPHFSRTRKMLLIK
jgi:hypothetical protein